MDFTTEIPDASNLSSKYLRVVFGVFITLVLNAT